MFLVEKAEREAVCGRLLKAPNKNMKKEKPKIIFSNYDDMKNPYYGGGGALAVHEVAKRFVKKFDITVITGVYPGAKDEVIDGICYKRIGASFFGPKVGQLIYLFLIGFYAALSDFDVWVESLTPPFSFSLVPLAAKRPVIGLVHMLSGKDMSRKYKLPFQLIEKVGIKLYKYFIVLSEETKLEIKKYNPDSEIEVISNGVSIPRLGRENIKRKHILFIGRIEINQKGLDLLLNAFNRVNDQIGFHLAIAGNGCSKEIKKLEKIIKNKNLAKKIKFLGRVEGREKEKAFNEAAFVVIPSRFETFPLVALETFSYGLPLVSFDIDGLKWTCKTCSLKAEPFKEKALAKAILNLASDAGKRKKMGSCGRIFARKFSWDKKAEKYADFIMKVARWHYSGQPSFLLNE